jgi:hypothetical protein
MQRENELRDLAAENERLRGVLTDMHGFAIEQIKGTATDMEAAGIRAIKAAVDNINTQLVQPLIAERDAAVAALAEMRARIEALCEPSPSERRARAINGLLFPKLVRADDVLAALAATPTGQEER